MLSFIRQGEIAPPKTKFTLRYNIQQQVLILIHFHVFLLQYPPASVFYHFSPILLCCSPFFSRISLKIHTFTPSGCIFLLFVRLPSELLLHN